MAKLSGWHDCIKYLLFTFNFLFWLLGCAIVAIGLWILIDPHSLQNQTTNRAFDQFLQNSAYYGFQSTGAYILICVGVVVMVIGFIGCFGALRENRILLAIFFALLTLLFVVLLVSGIYAVVAKDRMRDYVHTKLLKAARNYRNNADSKQLMDFVQITFKCCGASDSGVNDYAGFIPESCGNYVTACTESVYVEMTPNLIVIAGVAVGIAIVLLLGMFFSMSLCCVLRT